MCGCTVVFVVAGALMALTHGVLMQGFRVPAGVDGARLVVLIMIYTEAAIALCCLLGRRTSRPLRFASMLS